MPTITKIIRLVQGVAGPGLLYGAEPPDDNDAAAVAPEGSFYIDTAEQRIYGPKADGDWGAGASLMATVTVSGGFGRFSHEGTNYKFPVYEDI